MTEPVKKDSVTIGLERLIQKFSDKPNIVATLEAYLENIQKVEDLAFEVGEAFNLTGAIGVQVDTIGKLVGVKRAGLTDSDYLWKINRKISANASDGTINSIMRILPQSFRDSVSYPNGTNNIENPLDPTTWMTTELDGTVELVPLSNPVGLPDFGLATNVTGGYVTLFRAYGATSIDAKAGDKVASSVVVKGITEDTGLRFISFIDSVQSSNDYYNPLTGAYSESSRSKFIIEDLGEGFSLVTVEYVVPHDCKFETQVLSWNVNVDGESRGPSKVGSQLYLQAAFSGKIINGNPYRDFSNFNRKSNGKVTYSGVNLMPSPFDPSGWAGVSDLDGKITTLKLNNPSGSPELGLIESVTGDRFSFTEVRNQEVSGGDYVYLSVIFKPITDQSLGIRFRFFIDNVEIGDGYARPIGQVHSTSLGDLTFKFTDLGDEFTLMQCRCPVTASTTDFDAYMQYYRVNDLGQSTGFALIGDQAYVQAAYFGKGTDWPATYTEEGYNDTKPFEYIYKNEMPSPFNPLSWSNNSTKTSITQASVSNPVQGSTIGLIEHIEASGTPDSICDGNPFAVKTGDKVSIAIVAKNVQGDNGFRLRFADETGFLTSVSLNIETGLVYSGGGLVAERAVDLGDGWKYFEANFTTTRDATAFVTQVLFEDGSTSLDKPATGNKFYATAVFSGVTSGSPALFERKVLNEVESFQFGPNNVHPDPYFLTGTNWSTSADRVSVSGPRGVVDTASITQSGTATIIYTNTNMNDLSITAGESSYMSILFRVPEQETDFGILFSTSTGSSGWAIKLRSSNLDVLSNTLDAYRIVDLGDGWKLFEGRIDHLADIATFQGRVVITQVDNFAAAPTGSTLQMQAYYFGKSVSKTDWPSNFEREFYLSGKSTNLFVSDTGSGSLTTESASSDPDQYIYCDGVDFDGSLYNAVRVSWKGVAWSGDPKLMFGTELNPEVQTGAREVLFSSGTTVVDSAGYNVTTIDMSGVTEWTGSEGDVTKVAIKISNGESASIKLDYFGIMNKELDERSKSITNFVYSKAIDKGVELFDHYPAEFFLVTNDTNFAEFNELVNDIKPVGVLATTGFTPIGYNRTLSRDITLDRGYLIDHEGAFIKANDGSGNLDNIVVVSRTAGEGSDIRSSRELSKYTDSNSEIYVSSEIIK